MINRRALTTFVAAILTAMSLTQCDLISTLTNGDETAPIVRDNPYDPGADNFIGVSMLEPLDTAALNAFPTLVWEAKPDATAYHVMLDNDADFSSPLINDATTTGTEFYPHSYLADGNTYYWKMRYQNDIGEWSVWNRAWSFSLSLVYPTLLWSYTTGGMIESSPAIGFDGTVYITSADNKLHALSPAGTLLWEYPAGGEIISSPVVGPDGTIHIVTFEANLYVINPDGSLKWTFYLGDFGSITYDFNLSPAVGSDSTVYVGGLESDWMFYAVNPDGSEKWKVQRGNTFNTAAIGASDTIYSNHSTDLLSINSLGVPNWDYDAGDNYYSLAIGADETIYGITTGTPAYFHGVNANGTKKFKVTIDNSNAVWSSPAVSSSGTVYFVSGIDAKLSAYSPNGVLSWAFQIPNSNDLFGGPVIGADLTIYIGSTDAIIAINPDGTERWQYVTSARVTSTPALTPNGTLYFGCDDDTLYAISTESQGLDSGPWPKWQKDNQNSGRY